MSLLAAFLGGGLGSSLRYLVGEYFKGDVFWAVLVPNLIGCALIGIMAETLLVSPRIESHIKVFFVVGLLGGYTTFSSYVMFLGAEGVSLRAASFFLLHNCLGILFFVFFAWVTRLLWMQT